MEKRENSIGLVSESSNQEQYHLLIPTPELIVPMNAILGFSALVLKENRGPFSLPDELRRQIEKQYPNSVPDELRIWVEKHCQKFADWAIELKDISSLNKNNSNSEQQCQRIVKAFEGIEIVIAEGKSVSQSVSIIANEKNFFDPIIDGLIALSEHYRVAQDYLINQEQ